MKVAVCIFACLVVAAGCESPTEATRGHLVLSADSVQLERGTGRSITASYVDARGKELPHGPLKFYTDNYHVAWVSTTGDLHAVGRGATKLIVSCEGARDSIPVTVTDTAGDTPSYFAAFPGPIQGWPGDSLSLWGSVVNKWGERIATASGVAWTSSNPLVATVNDSGSIHLLAPGTARIVGAIGSVRNSLDITVRDSTPFIEGTSQLIPGASLDLSAWAFDHGQREMGRVTAMWTTSDPSVASVSNSGTVAAAANGTATITATAGGLVVRKTITVASLTGTLAFRRTPANVVTFLSLDGSAPVDVDVDPARAIGMLALSPDGSKLVYECGADVCRYDLADRTRFTIATQATDPSFTADGQTLGIQKGGWFATVGVDGGPTRRAGGPEYVVRPRIARDGSGFLYLCSSTDDYYDSVDVCYADAQGTTETLVALNSTEFSWSPVADSIAYVRTVYRPADKVSVSRVCATPRGGECSSWSNDACFDNAHEPSWSRDGRYLVFVKDASLWIASPDGAVCMRLSQAAISGSLWAASPTWGGGAVPPAAARR